MRRVIFLGPINFPELEDELSIRVHIGAAYRKVAGLVASVNQSTPMRCYFAGAPVLPRNGPFFVPGKFNRGDRTIRGASSSFRLINRLVASLFYLILVVKFSRKSSFIFYNFGVEYVPALMYLAITGNRGHLDIEDLPVAKASLRELFNWIGYLAAKKLMHQRFLAASSLIAERVVAGSRARYEGIVVHGVLNDGSIDESNNICDCYGRAVKIIHCGSINVDTGTPVVVSVIRELNSLLVKQGLQAEFHISGFGDLEPFRVLASDRSVKALTITVHEDLTLARYKALLSSCDIGLCMKDPNSQYGSSTFPSKIIEFASVGLGVVTLDFVDVRNVFGDTLVVVPSIPKLIAERLLVLIIDRVALCGLRKSIRRRAFDLYSSHAVAQRIVQLTRRDDNE